MKSRKDKFLTEFSQLCFQEAKYYVKSNIDIYICGYISIFL